MHGGSKVKLGRFAYILFCTSTTHAETAPLPTIFFKRNIYYTDTIDGAVVLYFNGAHVGILPGQNQIKQKGTYLRSGPIRHKTEQIYSLKPQKSIFNPNMGIDWPQSLLLDVWMALIRSSQRASFFQPDKLPGPKMSSNLNRLNTKK